MLSWGNKTSGQGPTNLHNSHEVTELLVELCHGELHGDACARAAGLDRDEVLQNIVLQGATKRSASVVASQSWMTRSVASKAAVAGISQTEDPRRSRSRSRRGRPGRGRDGH